MRLRAFALASALTVSSFAGGVLAFTGTASAGTDFCTALKTFNVTSSNKGASSTADEAASARDAFEQLAKADAPKNVQRAVLRIASFYDALASAGNAATRTSAAAKHIRDYTNGYKVFIKYYSKTCLGSSTK